MKHSSRLMMMGLAVAFASHVVAQTPSSVAASGAAPKTRAEVKADLKASRPKGVLPSQSDMDQMGNPLPTPRKAKAPRKAKEPASSAVAS